MILLIGYGNPLRTDDGVGQAAVETIAADHRRDAKSCVSPDGEHRDAKSCVSPDGEHRDAKSCVSTVATHQLLPEHAEPISRADRVIFVDADAGPQPGQITVHQIVPDTDGSAGLIHDFTPQTLLAYAQILYGDAPPATLLTVSGFSFDYGETLSPQMTAVLPDLLQRINDLL